MILSNIYTFLLPDWNQFVTNKLWAWEQTNLAWAKNFTGDLCIVFYDQLVDDVEGTIRGILKFVHFPVNEVMSAVPHKARVPKSNTNLFLQDLLQCALLRQEGIYRRKKRIMPFDPYTPAMHAVIDQRRAEVYAALGRTT